MHTQIYSCMDILGAFCCVFNAFRFLLESDHCFNHKTLSLKAARNKETIVISGLTIVAYFFKVVFEANFF